MEAAMAASKLPDVEFVNQCVIYDPDTGIFTWRERPREHFVNSRAWAVWNSRYVGQIAGTQLTSKTHQRVYWIIRLNREHWLAHRLAWLLMHGTDAGARDIDHIDRNGMNNRISNLRLATRGQNNVNSCLRKDNTTGVKGVHPNRKGYMARVYLSGKLLHLGTFPTIEEAAEARRKAVIELHGEYARHE
jgi:hypothetical protein